jgi:hypothetical protein
MRLFRLVTKARDNPIKPAIILLYCDSITKCNGYLKSLRFYRDWACEAARDAAPGVILTQIYTESRPLKGPELGRAGRGIRVTAGVQQRSRQGGVGARIQGQRITGLIAPQGSGQGVDRLATLGFRYLYPNVLSKPRLPMCVAVQVVRPATVPLATGASRPTA